MAVAGIPAHLLEQANARAREPHPPLARFKDRQESA
jgi:hypothetical protein